MIHSKTLKAAAIALLVLLAGGLSAAHAAADSAAGASAWEKTEQTAVRLIAAGTTTGDKKQLRLGLQFKMEPGWKVYWRAPGDAGFPPHLDWTGSRNLASTDIQWPAPERFSVVGLETLGYKKEVVFPIAARTVTDKQGVDLAARVRYLTCNDICIPYEANLALSLPAGPPQPGALAHLIDRYRATVPGDGRAHGIDVVSAHQTTTDTGPVLRVTARGSLAFKAPDLYVEGPPGLAYDKPKVVLSDGDKVASLEVAVDGVADLEDAKGPTLVGRDVTLTLVDGMRSAERKLAVIDGAKAAAPPPAASVSLLSILALAVLGGLILNLMPCVLPVLSIKLLSLVKHGGGEARKARAGFLASAAGIISSFLVLAGALAFLKAGGMAVGWGIQFQQPLFLIAMALLVTVFACNLFGFFEVALPAWAGGFGGSGDGQGSSVSGSFIQGAFATLLATPCSAPFLGTAVGFALAGSSATIFAVFAALGLGLALPYLSVAAFPALATRMPRPGPWMVTLRKILGLALAATAVWLVTVLAATLGRDGALAVGALLALAALGLYIHHRGLRPALAGFAIFAVAVFFVPALTPGAAAPSVTGGDGKLSGVWKPFDEAAIPGLVKAGHTVLVDVTADWCITCRVNKQFVLAAGQVAERLGGTGGVIALQADWTRPDDAISAYLAKFGRYGIPFNIVYGPKAPDGIPLPELLSEDAVLAAFDKAGGDTKISAK